MYPHMPRRWIVGGVAVAVAVLLPCGQVQAGCVTMAVDTKGAANCILDNYGATLTFCGCKINVDCEGEVTCSWTYDKTFYADAGRCELLGGLMSFTCGEECDVGNPCPPLNWSKVVLDDAPCPPVAPCPNCLQT